MLDKANKKSVAHTNFMLVIVCFPFIHIHYLDGNLHWSMTITMVDDEKFIAFHKKGLRHAKYLTL